MLFCIHVINIADCQHCFKYSHFWPTPFFPLGILESWSYGVIPSLETTGLLSWFARLTNSLSWPYKALTISFCGYVRLILLLQIMISITHVFEQAPLIELELNWEFLHGTYWFCLIIPKSQYNWSNSTSLVILGLVSLIPLQTKKDAFGIKLRHFSILHMQMGLRMKQAVCKLLEACVNKTHSSSICSLDKPNPSIIVRLVP